MRLLFCTTPLEGHFRPLLPLARSLAARGHDVAFATAASWHADRRGRGLRGARRRRRPHGARSVRLDAGWDAIQELPALDRRPYVFSYLFAQGHAPLKLPTLLDAARAWRAQALVYESGDLAAPVAAASLRLPSVNHGFGTMVSLSILERAAPAVAPLWRGVGLEPAAYAGAFRRPLRGCRAAALRRRPSRFARASGCGSRSANRATPPPWLELLAAAARLRDHGHGLQQPAPLRAARSTGSRASAQARFSPSAETSIPPSSAPVPANVRVERFVPQAQVLPSCAAVVSHGGSGTLLGALAHGCRSCCAAGRGPVRERGPLRARRRRGRASAGRADGGRNRDRRAARARRARRIAETARRIAAEFEQMGTPDEVAAAVEEHVGAR